MIIGIIGGVGSGKSVLASKFAYESSHHCFVNYDLRVKNITRIKKEHIIQEDIVDVTARGKPITEFNVNWGYWNKQLAEHGNYNIILDEVHNIVHSRKAMTKWNVVASMWISQIRKILGEKEETHIYLISQKLARIDSAFRDLVHHIIYCEKTIDESRIYNTTVFDNGKRVRKKVPAVYVFMHHFMGENCLNKYENFLFGMKSYDYKSYFLANPYFQLYNSYQLFGETAYL